MHLSSRIAAGIFWCVIALLYSSNVFSQPGKITIDLEKDKPVKYKTRVLKSEKTGQKKFTLPRRFVQNTTSHYNYYFNANNKFNEVIDRARYSAAENYFKLLPFYGYSLERTSGNAGDLDSIIYKATAGVLLHDLRSDWVDNFYLLLGKAYLLKKEFDSAAMTFQFINYNLYPKNKKDQDQMLVGSNVNSSGGGSLSIANKEKKDVVHKVFSRPPSRNDAFIWQIRTLTEMEEYGEASGLINTLYNDPNFPARLMPALEEVNAYWFYKQGMYDSAAHHLEGALDNSFDIQQRARSEYLLGQLYEMNKDRTKAISYYNKAIRHTTDPLMDIYANLNMAKMFDSSGGNKIDVSVANLLKMAKRDKFDNYRDIIYYSAAEIILEKPDTAAAIDYLKKSLEYSASNPGFKNKTFLKLADLSFLTKKYKQAYSNYDSLQTGDSTLADWAGIEKRKNMLALVVRKINIIDREDSLQKVAALPEKEREAFIKKLVKQLRKERGLKDESKVTGSAVFNEKNATTDIFSGNTTKGDWYFYNPSIKAKGYTAFKSKWGKRENVDNWRRSGAGDFGVANAKNDKGDNVVNNDEPTKNGVAISGDVDAPSPFVPGETDEEVNIPTEIAQPAEITYEAFVANVPVTPETLTASHKKISDALYSMGRLYQNTLEDYSSAVQTYERSLKDYPDSLYNGELYMNLSYCYLKLGDQAKADFYKNLLNTKYAGSNYAKLLNNPKAIPKKSAKDPEATKSYETIYNLFIEGQFDKALELKKAADSLYANNYWSPQLLYIQSIYYIRQKQDSLATVTLNDLVNLYNSSPLADKASTMLDVLSRRSEIEEYLTNLTIERDTSTAKKIIVDETEPATPTPAPVAKNLPADSLVKKTPPPVTDTAKQVAKTEEPKPVNITPPKVVETDPKKPVIKNGAFTFNADEPHYVVMWLDKVDPVFISEARTAFNRYNRDKSSAQPLEILRDTLDKDRTLLVFKEFSNAAAAYKYSENVRRDAAVEVSWLPSNKYSFFIISQANLDILKENKDFAGYLNLLNKALPTIQ